MLRPSLLLPTLAGALAIGCADLQSPTGVTAGPTGTPQAGSRATFTARGAQGASHGIPLTEEHGSGLGTVNVTATAEGAGFTAQITVNAHGLAPNTTYFVQRSPDFPVPPWTTNGVCERAAGIFPPGVPATSPLWITFPTPNPGPPVTIETSPGGAGATSFAFDLPAAAELAFDVMFRVVDNTTAPTRELRTPCFTVTPK
jgi:hypothetical protein